QPPQAKINGPAAGAQLTEDALVAFHLQHEDDVGVARDVVVLSSTAATVLAVDNDGNLPVQIVAAASFAGLGAPSATLRFGDNGGSFTVSAAPGTVTATSSVSAYGVSGKISLTLQPAAAGNGAPAPGPCH